MKRLIVAVAFAALSVPAFADVGLPYFQNTVDGALPQIAKRASHAKAPHAAPYEQQVIDSSLPNIDARRSASAGDTGTTHDVSPWASDFRFAAPPR
jgi:hypothetical protein